jgi:multiple sugar transport system substrate-binding protein
MIPEQRSAFHELITWLRSGRLSRRTFLERALTLGLSSVSALSLLESCSGSHDSTVYVVWQADYDPSDAHRQLVYDFNKLNQGRIQVVLQVGPNVTNDLATIERNILNAQSAAVDIFSVDMISVAEFARKGWLQPISESRWSQQERAKYLQVPIQACTIDGQLWAVPFRSNAGLLYYRTDFIPHPPSTWEELTSMAGLARQDGLKYGYVWQGAEYEGLVCNFDEVLHGYGGSLFSDPFHPTVVTVDSSQARQALETMVDWIQKSKISPADTTTYTEEVTRSTWENDGALFMRNWPYAYASSQQKLAHKFGIHSIPTGGNNTLGHSSLGGWQLAINKNIHAIQQDAAWEFIQYLLQPEAQKIGATVASWAMTLMSLYEDQEILRKVPLYGQLKPLLQTALPRPIAPNYADMSTAIVFYVRQALTGQASVSEALRRLAAKLEQLVNNNQVS